MQPRDARALALKASEDRPSGANPPWTQARHQILPGPQGCLSRSTLLSHTAEPSPERFIPVHSLHSGRAFTRLTAAAAIPCSAPSPRPIPFNALDPPPILPGASEPVPNTWDDGRPGHPSPPPRGQGRPERQRASARLQGEEDHSTQTASVPECFNHADPLRLLPPCRSQGLALGPGGLQRRRRAGGCGAISTASLASASTT